MLRQSLKALIFLLISVVWHVTAAAQTAFPNSNSGPSFSYGEKTHIIALAKLGDAEALYQLGLAYQSGVHADRNDDIAQRFFFYADKNGHPDSGKYLDPVDNTPAPSVSYTPAYTPAHTPPLSAPPPIPDAPKQVEAVKSKAKKAKAKKAKAAKVKAAKTKARQGQAKGLAPVVQPDAAPSTKQPAKSNVTKQASNTAVTQPRILATPKIAPSVAQKPKTFLRYLTYFLFGIGLILMAGFIAIMVLRYIKMQKSGLPWGFDEKLYLELNPDVERAGVNPVQHYINHGRAEGRKISR